jgi:hypothetical protein
MLLFITSKHFLPGLSLEDSIVVMLILLKINVYKESEKISVLYTICGKINRNEKMVRYTDGKSR